METNKLIETYQRNKRRANVIDMERDLNIKKQSS